jgi:sugar phosphate isomerase/epimerase
MAAGEAVKLSFSTLGCPDWSFDEIVSRAKAYGFDGVGFRGVLGELDLAKVPQFGGAEIAATRGRLAAAGLVASMVLTSTRLIVPAGEVEANLRLAESHIDIAAALGAPYIRVFGGQFPIGLSHAAAVARAAERLHRLGDHAGARGVVVLLETHDDFTDPALLRRVMEATDHPAVGVLWDVHHPFRILGQPVETAHALLAPWVRSVDLKDSIADRSAPLGYRYVPIGDGDVPIAAALGCLRADGYDGFLTFEWEKLWHPELAAPDQAFPQFVGTLRRMLAT